MCYSFFAIWMCIIMSSDLDMPVTTLNFSRVSQLPATAVQSLQDIARREDKVNLSARGRLYCIHYIEMLDGFTVELVKGSFLDKLLRREYRMAEIVIELERQLNGGNTFLEAYFAFSQRELSSADWKKRTDLAAQEKIPCRSFNVNPGDFSCSKGVLTCQ